MVERGWSRASLRCLVVGVLLLGVGWSSSTSALCQLAMPENSYVCEYDGDGQCCLIVEPADEGVCLSIVCFDYSTCSWDEVLPALCG